MFRLKSKVKHSWPRRLWRWCRWAILLVILVLVFLGWYLQQVGLPESMKSRLVNRLEEKGLHLEFSDLKVNWMSGIFAEDVILGWVGNEEEVPLLVCQRVRFKFNYAALLKGDFQPESLKIEKGSWSYPLPDEPTKDRAFNLTDIYTELEISNQEEWQLKRFQTQCQGIPITLSGTLLNASYVRYWKNQFKGSSSKTPSSDPLWKRWHQPLEKVLEQMENWTFSQPPELNAYFQVDLKNPDESRLNLNLIAHPSQFQYGSFESLRWDLELRLHAPPVPRPVNPNPMPAFLPGWELPDSIGGELKWDLQLTKLSTIWGQCDSLHFHCMNEFSDDILSSWKTSGTLRSHQVFILKPELELGQLRLTFNGQSSPTHPLSGFSATLEGEDWQHPQGALGSIRCDFSGVPTDSSESSSWLPIRLAPLAPLLQNDISAYLDLSSLQVKGIEAETLRAKFLWNQNQLTLEDGSSELLGGKASAIGQWNIPSHQVKLQGSGKFDYKGLLPALNAKSQRWLEQFTWEQSPRVVGQLDFNLPTMSVPLTEWRESIRESLWVRGFFDAGAGSFRTIPIQSARGDFVRWKGVWEFPDLTVQRPEGILNLKHRYQVSNKAYYWNIQGTILPQALKPLVQPQIHPYVDRFHWNQPVTVQAEARGQYHQIDLLSFQGHLKARDFSYHNEAVDQFEGSATLTNRNLVFHQIEFQHQTETLRAQSVGLDLNQRFLSITNAEAFMDPMRVARVIGTNAVKVLSPYQFLSIPNTRLSGGFSLTNHFEADMQFDISVSSTPSPPLAANSSGTQTGEGFRFWKFQFPQLTTQLYWKDQTIVLTNTLASFYEGQLAGQFHFLLHPKAPAEFSFQTYLDRANIEPLLFDLTTRTNPASGLLSGNLHVHKATTDSPKSWVGSGEAHLRNGHLWKVSLFSGFSPILNIFYPGLGNSQGGFADATFTLQNGIIYSDDLELREPALRLLCRGNVDLEGNLDAKIEARLLRDTVVMGKAVSLFFTPLTKVFEYEAKGTLKQPKLQPLYILPRILQIPLTPWKSLKEILPGGSLFPQTNE